MKPIVADNKPIPVNLKAGQTYYFCRCGRSKNQPFCDGSHKGTPFTPLKFVAEEDGEAWLCQCKQTHNAPFCDGSHSKVPPEMVGHEFSLDDVNTAPEPASESVSEEKVSAKPVVADNKPIPVNLKAGQTYYFCRCGRSKNQPFCDGSHKGTPFTSLKFVAEEDGEAWLCQCKQTHNAPFCDGSHSKVPPEMVGHEFSLDDVKAEAPAPAAESVAAATSPEDDEMPAAHPTPEEPTVAYIHQLAREGWAGVKPHGVIDAMGVPRSQLPDWNNIQIMVAQLAHQPLMDDAPVETELVIGPRAAKPLHLKIPLFVSDMSFGALSEEAKISLAMGAEMAGTGIASGEGGMLPEEQEANSRYLFEYASGRFGFSEEVLSKAQAFHFKCGQSAKTGTGGHLPGRKVSAKIAAVRGLQEGQDAISPATFADLHSSADFARFADHVRELTGGIPIGFKLSAQHIEEDIDFALQAGADYIIIDGRGGGTGAAPLLFRDHISVPTIPALARARRRLEKHGAQGRVTLIITGGIRTPVDFVKALALGADGIALANSAMQAIGCVGARICHTNLCPTGIATQDPKLRRRLKVDVASQRLANFFEASVELMKVLARACGHSHLNQFNKYDISSWHKELAELAGIEWSGYSDDR